MKLSFGRNVSKRISIDTLKIILYNKEMFQFCRVDNSRKIVLRICIRYHNIDIYYMDLSTTSLRELKEIKSAMNIPYRYYRENFK